MAPLHRGQAHADLLSTLADFDVSVLYKPGRLKQAADALSRRPCPLALQGGDQWEHFASQPVVCTTQDIRESAMNCAISESFCQSSFVCRCVEAYANDPDMAGSYHYLREGSRDEYLFEYDLYSMDADTEESI